MEIFTLKNNFMKLIYILTSLIFLFLISCSVSKETNADNFFSKWEQDSEIIFNKRISKGLEIDVNQIATLELCENSKKDSYINYPNLKYSIVQENIKVSLSERLTQTLNQLDFNKQKQLSDFDEKIIFNDSIFNYKLNCNSNSLKPLILTNEYKKKINGKLKYGLGSLIRGKNQENARAILEAHHTSNFFTLKYKINGIKFNQKKDSALVQTTNIYDSYGKLYVKENNTWKFVKEIYHLVE